MPIKHENQALFDVKIPILTWPKKFYCFDPFLAFVSTINATLTPEGIAKIWSKTADNIVIPFNYLNWQQIWPRSFNYLNISHIRGLPCQKINFTTKAFSFGEKWPLQVDFIWIKSLYPLFWTWGSIYKEKKFGLFLKPPAIKIDCA